MHVFLLQFSIELYINMLTKADEFTNDINTNKIGCYKKFIILIWHFANNF